MRLGTKLLISFITVALLVLITGSLSYYLSNEIKKDLILESGQTTEQLQILTEMTVQLQNSLLYTRNFLIESNKQRQGDRSNTTASQVRQARDITISSLDEFYNELNSIRSSIASNSPENQVSAKIRSLTDSLDTSFIYYDSLIRELYELEREGSYGDEVFNVTVEPYFRNTLLPILLQVRGTYNQRVDLQQAELQQRAEQTITWIIIITVLAFITSVGLAYLVYRSITIPVQKLTKAAETIGAGDFSNRIELHTNDELAHFAATFNEMAENLSKSMVTRSYVNNIIQSMGDMLIVTNLSGKIELTNSALSDTLHYTEEELENSEVWDIIDEEQRERIQHQVENSPEKSSFIETRFVSGKGERIPVILSFSYLDEGLDKKPKRVYVASDITVQKEAEKKISNSLKEKNVMLAEIHHRVKNNLAVINGLLEMQIWNFEGEESAKVLRESQLRIQSIALVHEKLYQSDNFASIYISDYVKELVESIASSFKMPEKEIHVDYEFDQLNLTINQAIPFSLLLNESVVNVYKYAFNETKTGNIVISLKRKGDKAVLKIDDDGAGIPGEEDSDYKLGMTIIDTLSKQLEGNYSIKNEKKGGASFIFTFPAVT
ncbi:MAG: histidine kinase dimerization/phosphoacceptor domain -containing protein [Balneolaceae bacterium]